MKFLDWLEKECNKEEQKDNIFLPPIESQEAIHFLKDYLLGEDWYSTVPSTKQVNTEIVYNILLKYSKEFRKELKKYEKK